MPSHRRYLKFGSISQISHVACVCAEMSPKSIGCFEMDVNMNLCAIYPSPFGCLWSVAALKGHERVFNLSWFWFFFFFKVRSPVVPRSSCVRKCVKDDGIRKFRNKMCRHWPIRLIVNVQQRLRNKCGLKSGVLVRSHSCRRTKRNLNIVRAC